MADPNDVSTLELAFETDFVDDPNIELQIKSDFLTAADHIPPPLKDVSFKESEGSATPSIMDRRFNRVLLDHTFCLSRTLLTCEFARPGIRGRSPTEASFRLQFLSGFLVDISEVYISYYCQVVARAGGSKGQLIGEIMSALPTAGPDGPPPKPTEYDDDEDFEDENQDESYGDKSGNVIEANWDQHAGIYHLSSDHLHTIPTDLPLAFKVKHTEDVVFQFKIRVVYKPSDPSMLDEVDQEKTATIDLPLASIKLVSNERKALTEWRVPFMTLSNSTIMEDVTQELKSSNILVQTNRNLPLPIFLKDWTKDEYKGNPIKFEFVDAPEIEQEIRSYFSSSENDDVALDPISIISDIVIFDGTFMRSRATLKLTTARLSPKYDERSSSEFIFRLDYLSGFDLTISKISLNYTCAPEGTITSDETSVSFVNISDVYPGPTSEENVSGVSKVVKVDTDTDSGSFEVGWARDGSDIPDTFPIALKVHHSSSELLFQFHATFEYVPFTKEVLNDITDPLPHVTRHVKGEIKISKSIDSESEESFESVKKEWDESGFVIQRISRT